MAVGAAAGITLTHQSGPKTGSASSAGGKEKPEQGPPGGAMVEKEFELGKTLGEGNYAQVKLGKEKSTGHMWAVKVINKKKLEPGDEEMLALEVEVLREISHPNVIHLYKVYDTKYKMYMVLELVTGGELLERLMNLGAYSEQDACDLFAKVMHAVSHLHSHGIAHRDLKPE